MTPEIFHNLPTEEIARLVREKGGKVCVFPVNGTRRWLMLEHAEEATTDYIEAYLRIVPRRMVELFGLIFDHGVDTLLAPMVGPDLLERGEDYLRLAARGLTMFARNPDFLEFYDRYDVRVRFYGDAQRHLRGTSAAGALEAFDEVTRRTASHCRRRLFFGIFANDATETTAEIAIRFYQEHGHAPDRRQIVEAYYGEYVAPVDLFIGFGPFSAFDMPLLSIGREDLYFTVSPSPYLDAETLRAILYDHLYGRSEPEYHELTGGDWQSLRRFYHLNRRVVLGVGVTTARGRIWLPAGGVQPLGEQDGTSKLSSGGG